jgi:hypothetical protein
MMRSISLVLALLLATPSYAAIALVQRATNFDNGASSTLTVDIATPTQNNLLVAVLFTRSSAWTLPSGFSLAIEHDNTSNDDSLVIAYKVAGASEADPQWSGLDAGGDGTGAAASVYEFSGTATVSPFDDAEVSTGISSGTSKSSGTTATLAQADEVAIAGFGYRGVVPGATISFTNSYTIGPNTNPVSDGGGALAALLDAYRIVAATTAQETTASWTGTSDVIGAIATFKAGAGGSSGLLRRRRSN